MSQALPGSEEISIKSEPVEEELESKETTKFPKCENFDDFHPQFRVLTPEDLNMRASPCPSENPTLHLAVSEDGALSSDDMDDDIEDSHGSAKAPTEEEYHRIVDAIIAVIYEDVTPKPKLISRMDKIIEYIESVIPRLQLGPIEELCASIRKRYDYYCSQIKEDIQQSSSLALCMQKWEDVDEEKSFLHINCRFIVDSRINLVSIGFEEITVDPSFPKRILMVLEEWGIDQYMVEKVSGPVDKVVADALTVIFGEKRLLSSYFNRINQIAMRPFQIPGYGQDLFRMIVTDPMNDKRKYVDVLHQLSVYLRVAEEAKEDYPYMLDLNDDIRELLQVYKPFQLLANEFERDGVVPTSEIIPLIKCLLRGLDRTRPHSNWCKTIKETLDKELTDWFTIQYRQPLSLPTLLDPRFKDEYFSKGETNPAIVQVLQIVHDSWYQGIWKYHKSHSHKRLVNDYLSSPVLKLDSNPLKYYSGPYQDLRPVAEKFLISAEMYPPTVDFKSCSSFIEDSIQMHLFLASIRTDILANDKKVAKMFREIKENCPDSSFNY